MCRLTNWPNVDKEEEEEDKRRKSDKLSRRYEAGVQMSVART